MIKRILVGLSGTRYTPTAVQASLDLARAHNAEVTGVTILDAERLADVGPVPLGAGHHASRLTEHRLAISRDQIEEAVSSFKRECDEAGIRYRLSRERGDAFEALIGASRYHDIVVFGIRGLFEYTFTPGQPADELAKLVGAGVRPLLAVASGYRRPKRVLAAFSGSVESAKAIRRFVQMQPWRDVKLRAVHFGTQAHLLDDLGSYFGAHGVRVELKQCAGSPEAGLLREAYEFGADAIVLGNSAKSLLRRRIFGETAIHAMQKSERTLFLAQ